MEDKDLAELRQQTERGDRLEEDSRREAMAEFQVRVREELEKIESGNRQKTISVWDGPLAAFISALDGSKDLEAVGIALQRELGMNENVEALDRSELLRLALRAGFQEAAPEYLDSARGAIREHNKSDL